ncbi:Membrane-bound inhibitor of C-type lysozyme [Devosia crocina]|uniref:Membrane-bound inhibitor of C-type lysozyme n=1 Tax=Devosia crocina TaxID=429728 RepID=A0A1I7N6G3_9HYPH|nr:MliC family protein [Devosia crocina]SFV30255.1 Membrane-bound inhibitor of C-type lysozyme [Devosia crocina]
MIDLKTTLAVGLVAFATVPLAAQEAAPAVAPAEAPAPPLVSAGITLTLESETDIERRVVIYQCDNGEGFRVQYINAAPNFLAILPVEGETHLFATALSGSGARYVSGPYEWWSSGDEATLRDVQSDEDAAPLATCLAARNTP